MYKKLFALFMILSVAVLFTGCSNSNSYDKVPRPIPRFMAMAGDDGTVARIVFVDENGDNFNEAYDVKVVEDKKWIIDVYLNGDSKPKSITAEANNAREAEKKKVWLDFNKIDCRTYDVFAVDKSRSIYETDKIVIRKFAYKVNDTEYTVEPNECIFSK